MSEAYDLAPTMAPQARQRLSSRDRTLHLTCKNLVGGAEGIRTPDPLHAMEVRYQLRYSPVNRIWSRGIGRPEQHTGCIYLLAPTSAHPAGCTPPGQANIASPAAPAATVPRLSPVLVKGTEI